MQTKLQYGTEGFLGHMERDLLLTRRAREYWNIDGLPMLVGGVQYLLAAGLVLLMVFLVRHAAHPTGNWPYFADLIMVVFAFALISFPFWAIAALIWLSVNWEDVVEWFKVRLTYPRTGYVAPPRYWQAESGEAPNKAIRPEGTSSLCRALSVLGGFWFWVWVQAVVFHSLFWDWQPPLSWLLLVLLVIRALRFGIYPEPPIAQNGQEIRPLLQLAKFVGSVLNSFWLWLWLLELVRRKMPGPHPWIDLGVILWLAAFGVLMSVPAVHQLERVTRLTLLCGCVGASVLAFLSLKDPLVASCIGISVFAIYWAYHVRNMLASLKVVGICLCIALCLLLLSKGSAASIAFGLLLPGLYAAILGGFKLILYLRANPLPQL